MPNPYDADAETTGIARRQRHIVTMPLHQPDPAVQKPLLFDQEREPELTNKARFLKFHTDNPHIYLAFRDMALAQARAGAKIIRPKSLAEKLRDSGLRTQTDEPFALNNTFTRFYAELLAQIPELTGLVPMRRPTAE